MPNSQPKPRDGEIMLGLLEAVEAGGNESGGKQSQRRLASHLGIALGLVNIYLKRCVGKGLIKVRETPARRYAYYLTPQGFAEKSRLTAEYLSRSLDLFRRARTACLTTLAAADALGWRRVAVTGSGDLAEVLVMCAAEFEIELVLVSADDGAPPGGEVGAGGRGRRTCRAVVSSLAEAAERADGVIVADLHAGDGSHRAAVDAFGAERVLVPRLAAVMSAASAASDTPPLIEGAR